MEKTTYLSSIISALNKLNGMGSLNEIYDVIEKEGRLSYIFSNPNWKDNVRATIQRHCIQTKSYRGSEDLFRSVYGLGEGYWKLKDFDSSEYDNPIIDRQLKMIANLDISNTEKEMIIKSRIGQGIFRDRIIQKYEHCIITGINDNRLLLASHIKPWRSASNYERLSSENGLLLSPLYDKLFDIGLITFDDNMKILISNKLSCENVSRINIDTNKMYVNNPSDEMMVNMRYHRQNIFVE